MEQQVLKEAQFDEIFGSQKNFRILLDGMSRPGKVLKLGRHGFTGCPDGFNPYVLLVLKTLGDNNVTFYLSNLYSGFFDRYIEVNTGMAKARINIAEYAVFQGSEYDPDFTALSRGTLEFPEKSATAIIMVESVQSCMQSGKASTTCEIAMRGPGIKGTVKVLLGSLDEKYIKSILNMNTGFPLGIDTIFTDPDGNIACMPRTTAAEVKDIWAM